MTVSRPLDDDCQCGIIHVRDYSPSGKTQGIPTLCPYSISAHQKSCDSVEDLWDDLAATPEAVPVHDWQKEELASARRIC